MATPERTTIDDVLAEARARLHRMSPAEAAAAVARGALLVDIRPAAQRGEEGEIPGAFVIERNVLEWRLDPLSPSRMPEAVDHDVEVVVFCSEGYTSSLAAVSLQDLGIHRATDIDGGYHAWRRAGFAVTKPLDEPLDESPERRAGGRPGPAPDGEFSGAEASDSRGRVILDPGVQLGIEGFLAGVGGAEVELSSPARERLRAGREIVMDALRSGEPAYGLNAGLGHARDQRLSPEGIARYQADIVLSHAGGIGPPLPEETVRAAVLARLNSAVRGSALSERTAGLLAELLNAGVHPVVPAVGSVGASDLSHLAAIASVVIGRGEASYKGRVVEGGEALAAAGLVPSSLEPGEGLALVSANSMSIGAGCLAVARAQSLLEAADVAAALSLEAVDGNLSVVDPAVGLAKPVPGQIATIRHLRSLLSGSRLFEAGQAASLQDPLSFRVVPQVHGAARELLGSAWSAVELELNAVDDNPLVWLPEGRLISNGNHQPVAMALQFDALRPGLAHVALCAVRRLNHLGNRLFGQVEQFEELMAQAGDAGRGFSLYAGAVLWAELRHLAGPATLDVGSLDLEQEDHATAAPLTVAATDRVLDLLERTLAVELESASAVIARRRPPSRLGAGTAAAFELARPVLEDSGLSAAGVNEALTQLVGTGKLLAAVKAAMP